MQVSLNRQKAPTQNTSQNDDVFSLVRSAKCQIVVCVL